MPTKKRSSMAAVDSALAKQKADFDKAVKAATDIRVREHLEMLASLPPGEEMAFSLLIDRNRARKLLGDDDIDRRAGEMYGKMAGKNYSDNKALDVAIRKTISDANVGQFTTITSELMGKITDLGMVVDNLIDQLKPVTVPMTEEPVKVPANIPCQAQSEFVEFIECAGRRVDALREKIADTMARVTL